KCKPFLLIAPAIPYADPLGLAGYCRVYLSDSFFSVCEYLNGNCESKGSDSSEELSPNRPSPCETHTPNVHPSNPLSNTELLGNIVTFENLDSKRPDSFDWGMGTCDSFSNDLPTQPILHIN